MQTSGATNVGRPRRVGRRPVALAVVAALCIVATVAVAGPAVYAWWSLRGQGITTEGVVAGVRDGGRGRHLTVLYTSPDDGMQTRADLLVRRSTRAPVGSSVRFRADPRRPSNVAPVGYDLRLDFALVTTFGLLLVMATCAYQAFRHERVIVPTSSAATG